MEISKEKLKEILSSNFVEINGLYYNARCSNHPLKSAEFFDKLNKMYLCYDCACKICKKIKRLHGSK